MKTEQQQQVLRAHYEAFDKRDVEAVLAQMQPDVEKDGEGRHVVTAHQVMREMSGQVLFEKTVGQRFAMKDGLVTRFDILGAELQEAL